MRNPTRWVAVLVVGLGALPADAALQVTGVAPAAHSMAAASSIIVVTFDKAVQPATVTGATFRVFGKATGTKAGSFSFAAGDTEVTFTPSAPFAAGEVVQVNLSHDVIAADADPLRPAGYAFEFTIAAVPSGASFTEVIQLSNRTGGPGGPQTRIYGANATDLDEDGFTDLATVNEVSADVRVFLNAGTGAVAFDPFLTPQAIGVESSPNDAGDFDNDGHTDLATAAASDGIVTILLGNGDGSFASRQDITVGDEPHGIQALDVDGDGDLDLVNANNVSDELSLMLNDGSGSFGAPTFFESGLTGEYGLASGDMNGDGITDLVVGAREDQMVRTLLGNGDATFTGVAAQDSGGWTWVVQLGDLDGDLDLDASAANSFDNNGAILKNNGDGTFAAPVTSDVGAHTPSTDLADLDGDGDLDWILSSFGGGYWRLLTNDGTGTFTFDHDIAAPSNPSCAVPLDMDNDGDIDLALTDEIADRVVLMRNEGAVGPSPLCPATPDTCRGPFAGGKALALVKDRGGETDRFIWKWIPGALTTKDEFGDPLTDEDYALCVYDGTTLVFSGRANAGGTCSGRPCWKESSTGYKFKNKTLSPDGTLLLLLKAGADGEAKIVFKGKGANLVLPALPLTGPVTAQLQQVSGTVCWDATYDAPFLLNDGATFKDKPD